MHAHGAEAQEQTLALSVHVYSVTDASVTQSHTSTEEFGPGHIVQTVLESESSTDSNYLRENSFSSTRTSLLLDCSGSGMDMYTKRLESDRRSRALSAPTRDTAASYAPSRRLGSWQ